VVCSTCGYENQAGHRFCAMCGTPLPHRPLTAPGAHGTHTFTQVPLDGANRGRERTESPVEEANATAPRNRGGVIEMPGVKPSPARNSVPSPVEMVPEIPLDEYVRSFRYIPPADPDELTMRGDAEVLRPEAPAEADAPLVVAAEVTTATDANPVFATEDVGERLGLEESVADDERRDRPRLLDFSEPALSPQKPEVPEPVIAVPSFLGLGDTPLKAAQPPGEIGAGKPSRASVWTWVAVAALLVFVSLGLLEWRAQVNQTNSGPVEVLKMKLRNVWRGDSPAPQAAGSAEVSVARPVTQVDQQPKPQDQDQNPSSSPNAPSAAMPNKPAASDANPAANATNSQQSAPTVSESPAPAGQKVASPIPSASVSGSQTASTQKTVQPEATLPSNSSKVATSSEPTDVAQTETSKPKPKPPAAQKEDQQATVKKTAPGEEELAKANDASDAAAAAAWLWKATSKGNRDAPVLLADMYIKGDGVPRSCEQALVLLQVAATKGNAQARTRMAEMYSSGTCVQRDLVKAYRLLNAALAADPNNHGAALQNRDSIWREMTPEERADEQPPQH
jgi:TPR repeat protein